MTGRLPPVVRLALAFATGAAAPLSGVAFLTPLLLLLFALPIRASPRPGVRALLWAAVLAGVLASRAGTDACGSAPEDGTPAVVAGRLLAEGERTLPFRVTGADVCRRVIWVRGEGIPLGSPVRLFGRWRAWSRGETLEVDSARVLKASAVLGVDPAGAALRWRGHLVRRLHALFPRHAGVVAALVLARKEDLAPEVREAFARTGTAHLLAISGFHVGVVAGLLLLFVRRLGLSRRGSAGVAALGAWSYVAFIGFPSAACRAAWMLTAAALAGLRGRPPARFGGLGAALLLLLVWDPRSVTHPGFQLSFAGAASLTLWAARLTQALRRRLPAAVPSWAVSPVAAAVAATLGTLPVVAWHFERVSLVGIPATLVATPLVVLALPGALAALALDALHPSLGVFLAGGVDLVLMGLTRVTEALAGLEWASVWVARTTVLWAGVGAGVGLALASGRGVRRRVRRTAAVLCAVGAALAWPVLQGLEGRGQVEIALLDVGQGDAMGIRTPRGRWILVDAGPPGRQEDPRAHPVVRALRRRGVSRLALLVFTHPDLDHIGGGEAVLDAFAVEGVMDPGLAVGKGAYVALLDRAHEEGVPWEVARAGQRLEVDGVELWVLHPTEEAVHPAERDANDVSVVLRLSFGAFDALLTGDAPAAVERRLAQRVGGGVEVLKVGHHGSVTSTDALLLDAARPEVALISVGRGNDFGHPHPEVIRRLEGRGVPIFRTDEDGTLRILGRRDGSFEVASGPALRR